MNDPQQRKVLVVDDEIETRRLLRIGLEHSGFDVTDAATGEEGLGQCAVENPDLVVLDMKLPDLSGLDVLKRLREWSEIPVIVLSAVDGDQTIIEALNGGADDYVTKPFKMTVLIARLHANLRKRASGEAAPSVLSCGDIEVDFGRHTCRVRGKKVDLTPKEFELLGLLMKHEGKVLTHKFLLENVWGPANAEDREYVRVFIKQLREKVEADPAKPEYILTEMGVGYRLTDPANA